MERGQTWMLREGNERDSEGILSLRKIVFGEEEKDKQDEKFWRWEFKEGPDGGGFIYIVEDKDKIIGHFADIPRRFSVQGEEVLGTLSLDLMVHPDYWRRGIFAAMGNYGAERVKQGNGLFMTAFPIRLETIQGLRKIGWKGVVDLPVLVYPIRFTGIVKRYLHFAPLSLLIGGVTRCFYFFLFGWRKKEKMNEMEIKRVHELDEPFDAFWKKAASLYPIMGVRDRSYLNWRYLQHPTRDYAIYGAFRNGEMEGYMVLRKVELLNFNSAVIVDLLALDENALSALVKKGIQHSRQEGADLLGFMVPKIHFYYKVLRGMGFLPSFKTFQFMVYPHSDREILFSPRSWYVTWGDTDVI
jgi:GNAT superfamily N-acetyltransferase